MDATQQMRSVRRHPSLFIALALGITMALLLIWAARRDSRLGTVINQELVALAAAGEPIDAIMLARMFPLPPPALDASGLTNTVFPYVRTNRAPGITPIIMSQPDLGRTETMEASTLTVLQRHYDASAEITNVLPVLPAGTRFGIDWSKGVLNAPMVSFVSVRETIQMLSARVLYAAETGDAEGVTAMLERSFRFADAVAADSTLVEHMIRAACVKLACTMTERGLNRVVFSDAQLLRVLAAMPPPTTNDFLGTIRVEQCMAIWVFSEVRAGKRLDELLLSSPPKSWWERTWARLWPVRNEYSDEDFLAYLKLIPQICDAAKLPPPQASAECKRLFTTYASNATCEVAQSAIPNWAKAIDHHYEIEALVETTRAALSVERFRLAHQRLPGSLEALVPGFVPSVPMDPLDGLPLRIKPLTRGYVLYSVGLDGVDNGGLDKTNSSMPTVYDLTVTVER